MGYATPEITTTNTTVLLAYSGKFEDLRSAIRANLFGEMVKRAVPVIREGYYSDLFHEAAFVKAQINGPATFYWLVNNSGTLIDEAAIIWMAKNHPNEHTVLYRVEVTRDRSRDEGNWIAAFTTVPLADCPGSGRPARSECSE